MVAKMLLGGCLLAEVKSAQPQVSRNTSDLSVYGSYDSSFTSAVHIA